MRVEKTFTYNVSELGAYLYTLQTSCKYGAALHDMAWNKTLLSGTENMKKIGRKKDLTDDERGAILQLAAEKK